MKCRSECEPDIRLIVLIEYLAGASPSWGTPCSGSSPLYAPHSYSRPIQPTRNHLLQTPTRQSEFKSSSMEQPNSSTQKERKHSPSFVNAEASGSQVTPTFLLMLPTAPWSSTQPSRHVRD